jgi:predicted TIM-barrel fold metal-dependent hydrolase
MKDFDGLGVDDAVREKILLSNARRVLKLDV